MVSMQSTAFIIQNSLLSGIFLQKDKLSNVRGFLFFISSKGVEQLSSVLYINIGSIGYSVPFYPITDLEMLNILQSLTL